MAMDFTKVNGNGLFYNPIILILILKNLTFKEFIFKHEGIYFI